MTDRRKSVWKRLAAGVLLAAGLASCSTGYNSGSVGRGFEHRYSRARDALENQKYPAAIRRYSALVENSGPLESRMRLELAHALLRDDQYDEASRQAASVAGAHTGNRRAAALAVKGTADHRMAQQAMSEGDFGPSTVQRLKGAKSAYEELLSTAPDLDPLGAMRQRLTLVNTSLSQIGAG